MFFRPLIAVALLATLAGPAAAQGSMQEQSTCRRDSVRFCRSVLDQGDFAVLACLRQNRTKLSKACEKTLTDHGQ